MILKEFQEFINKIQSNNARIAKEEVLKEYKDNNGIKCLVRFIFDPYIVTGISRKKINKSKSFPVFKSMFNSIFGLLDYIQEHNHGSDEDLKRVNNFVSELKESEKELAYSIIIKDLKLGIQPITINKVWGEGFIRQFNVMLAEKYFDNPDKYVPEGTEFILSTKLDGCRCVLINREEGPEFYSRQGQVFEGLTQLEEEASKLPQGYVYDGELLLNKEGLESKDLYRETVKIVSSDNEKQNIIFNVFDILPIENFEVGYCSETSKERKYLLHNILNQDLNWFKEVKTLYEGSDKKQIQIWLDKITNEGGEGVMINLSKSPYECKRTKGLLKVKKMQTADVLVYDVEEGKGLNKGCLGAAKVWFLGPDGKEYSCDVGGGYTQEQRIDFWKNPDKLIGKIIEISYFEISSNQQRTYSMRFPVFKYIREDKTEISMY